MPRTKIKMPKSALHKDGDPRKPHRMLTDDIRSAWSWLTGGPPKKKVASGSVKKPVGKRVVSEKTKKALAALKKAKAGSAKEEAEKAFLRAVNKELGRGSTLYRDRTPAKKKKTASTAKPRHSSPSKSGRGGFRRSA